VFGCLAFLKKKKVVKYTMTKFAIELKEIIGGKKLNSN
jgi:hypothetical protein